MELATVVYEVDGAVGVLRLNRPERMNAVVEEMYLDVQEALDAAAAAPEVRALVLTGSVWHREAGDRQAFCAGADLKKHAAGERSAKERRDYILLAHETTRRVHDFSKPIVAAVNGPARGAGAELAVNCDFVLMADEATIAFPETGLGTFVGGGVTALLPRLLGEARAKRLVYLGEVLDGRAAVEVGLALASYPVGRLMDEAMALAGRLAERAPLSMALAKELLGRAPGLDLETVLRLEAEAILACMGTEDWAEGIRAFAERRAPRYEGR